MKITAFETIPSANDNRIPYYSIYTGKCLYICNSILLGYKIYPLIITSTLINAGLFYYYYRFLNYFNTQSQQEIIILITIFHYLTLFFMFLTSIGDPGIIPRYNQIYLRTEEEYLLPSSNTLNAIPYCAVSTHEAIDLRYCDICQIFKPPRTNHCRRCENCVQDLDHHCKWLGCCIGRRNYYQFFCFIISLKTLLSLLGGHLIYYMKTNKIYAELIAVLLLDLCFLAFLGYLVFNHLYYLWRNLTAIEYAKTPSYIQNDIDNFMQPNFCNIKRKLTFIQYSFHNRLLHGIREPFVKLSTMFLKEIPSEIRRANMQQRLIEEKRSKERRIFETHTVFLDTVTPSKPICESIFLKKNKYFHIFKNFQSSFSQNVERGLAYLENQQINEMDNRNREELVSKNHQTNEIV